MKQASAGCEAGSAGHTAMRKSETNIELATFGRLTSLAPRAPCGGLGGAKQQPQTEIPAPTSKPFLLKLECEKLVSSIDR